MILLFFNTFLFHLPSPACNRLGAGGGGARFSHTVRILGGRPGGQSAFATEACGLQWLNSNLPWLDAITPHLPGKPIHEEELYFLLKYFCDSGKWHPWSARYLPHAGCRVLILTQHGLVVCFSALFKKTPVPL